MTLRSLVFGVGCLLVLGAIVATLAQMRELSIELAISGLVLIGGVALEHWRYKPFLREPPGNGWKPTGERFIDTETGRSVEVYHDATSGKRVYVTPDHSSRGDRV